MGSLCAESCSADCFLSGADTFLPFFFSLSESDVVDVWAGNESLPCERSAQS